MENLKENKMGVLPIPKVMLSMGLPMIVSMMVQAFYNIVDSYFVSRISDTAEISDMGDKAVNALTLSYPVQLLIIAIGVGTGVGINSILSRSLGAGNRERASKIAGNAVFLGACTYVVFLIFGIFGTEIFLRTQTKESEIISLGTDYLKICSVFSFGAVGSMIYEKLLQGTGRTLHSTIAQLSGAIINIILDPILIFGYLGFPEMRVNGAAYATVIGQVVTLCVSMLFHYKFNKEIDGSIKFMKPEKSVISAIYRVGVPAILMQALMSIMTYGINIIFGMVSAFAVTAYGVYYKIQQFVFFSAFGMNNAIIPIVSFNYGMKSRQRVMEAIKWGIIYTLILMLIGELGFQIFAAPLSKVFALSEESCQLFIKAIRIVTFGYLFAGFNIACQGILQALGSGVKSLIISFIRLIAAVFPLAYLFTFFANAEDLIWLSIPAAEVIGTIVAVIFLKKSKKTI